MKTSLGFLCFLGHVSAQSIDNKGVEFLIGFLPNPQGGFETFATEIQVTSDVALTVQLEYPVGTVIQQNVMVTPGDITVLSLPTTSANAWTPDTVQSNMVRVISETGDEFVAYVINRKGFTSDAALALPIDTFNTEFIVSDHPGSVNGATNFLVYAAFDMTTVTITPKANLKGNRPAGVAFGITLSRGEGFLASAQLTATSLAGSSVTADKPIGMANGHECANIPPIARACDHIFEIAQP
jgi:IgGFc binding protein